MKNIFTFLFLVAFVTLSFAQNSKTWLRPAAQLRADYRIDEPDITLSWWEPGAPTWLFYGSGLAYADLSFGQGYFEVATKYESSDLVPYHGMSIKGFSFAAFPEPNYTLKIWSGNSGENLEYEQQITKVNSDAWTDIDLTTPFFIDSSKTYFIGLSIELLEAGNALAADNGPLVANGGFVRDTLGNFLSLSAYGIDRNWSMALYLELNDSVKKYESFLISETSKTCNSDISNFIDFREPRKLVFDRKPTSKTDAVSYYNIYRDNVVIATSTEPTYFDLLPEGGSYIYNVSAVYESQETQKTNAIEVFYDDDRIPVTKVIGEVFINTNEYSPNSRGAFLGITELKYEEENLAPIIYHSATDILGEDPYATADTEAKFKYYLLNTWSFPMANFNGDIFLGGGSTTESLYEPYKQLYNYALDRKTPMAIDATLEKISSSKYSLKVDAEMVGIYPDTGLVLHVVLTQEALDFEWYNGEFSQVRFVATKLIPNFEGTPLSFNDEGKTSQEVIVEIDPFAQKSNYRIVYFVQNKFGFTILNGDMLNVPNIKVIEFAVTDYNNQPLEGATVTINEESKITDTEGLTQFGIMDNVGEVSYKVSKPDFIQATGFFNIKDTDSIAVQLLPTSVNNSLDNGINIYPNPANTLLNITTAIGSDVHILNTLGEIICTYKQLTQTHDINISDYKDGIYIIQIKSHNTNESFKIVKKSK